VWQYLRHPMFSRFDVIPKCDRQTGTDRHTQTHDDGTYRASIASRIKKGTNRIMPLPGRTG